MAEHLSSIDLHASLANHFCLPWLPCQKVQKPPTPSLSAIIFQGDSYAFEAPAICSVHFCTLHGPTMPSVLPDLDTDSSADEGTVQPYCHLVKAWGPLVPSKLFRKSHILKLPRHF